MATRYWPATRHWPRRSPPCSTTSRPSSWRRREAVTRVIAGAARGRRLAVPPGRLTRPTSDRARAGLFGTLTAIRGSVDGARVLDLYAGSGAVGLEALSRGADRVLFVEADTGAARVIRANLAAVGLPGGHLVTDRVERVLARGLAGEPGYDLVVADPPYAAADDDVAEMLAALRDGSWLAPGAGLAVERAARLWGVRRAGSCLAPGGVRAGERAPRSERVRWPPGYGPARSRRYGEATFWYG